MNASQLVTYLNAIGVGDFEAIQAKLGEAEAACLQLQQPELAAAQPVDDPSPVDGTKYPDPVLPPSEPASNVSKPVEEGSVKTRGAELIAEHTPAIIPSPTVDVSDSVTDPDPIETTALDGHEPAPNGVSAESKLFKIF